MNIDKYSIKGSGTSGSSDFFTIPSSTIIFKYNPHQMKAEDILGTLVGRDELLSKITGYLREGRVSDASRHYFLYGARGMGKTTMLLALKYSIKKIPDLNRHFDIVQFSEEERRIVNLPSFAIRALELLSKIRPDVDNALEDARSNPEEAFDILLELSKNTNRQTLWLIDNFDDLVVAVVSKKGNYFTEIQEKAEDKFMEFLTTPGFRFVVTALKSPVKRKDFPKSLLKYFDPILKLEPMKDSFSFLKKRAKVDRREGFLKGFSSLTGRIEGINRLVDGNPRLLVFLYECLGNRPLADLVEIVQRTVDELTPMYQDVIDRQLNPGQAATLEMLASNGGVGSAKEIARQTFQNDQTVRTALGDLCDIGLVKRSSDVDIPGVTDEVSKKSIVFRTYPPLFQVWYEMRYFEEKKSLYLIRFLAHLLEPKEARTALKEAQTPGNIYDRKGLSAILENVFNIIAPEWEGIYERHVTRILAQGGTLQDSMDSLKKAILEANEDSSDEKIGLLAISSRVRSNMGNNKKASEDLTSAERLLDKAIDEKTIIKLLTIRSQFHGNIGEFFNARKYAEEAVKLYRRKEITLSGEVVASALLALSSILISMSDYNNALTNVMEAKGILSAESGSSLKIKTLNLLGEIHYLKGEYKNATSYFNETLKIAQEGENRKDESYSLSSLGDTYQAIGDYDKAMDHYERSFTINQEIRDRDGEAASLNNLGNVFHYLGDYDKAMEHYERSFTTNQEIGDRYGEAVCLGNLGSVYYSFGDYERARDYLERSLAVTQETGVRKGEGVCLRHLGNVFSSIGDYDRAKNYHERSLVIEQEIGDRQGEALSLDSLGNVFSSIGDYGRAKDYCERSLAIVQEIGNRNGEAASLNNLGSVYDSLGDYDRARDFFYKAYTLSRSIGAKAYIRITANSIVKCLYKKGLTTLLNHDYEQLIKLHKEAIELSEDAGVEGIITGFLDQLFIPALSKKRAFSSQLILLISNFEKEAIFKEFEQIINSLKSLLLFYEKDHLSSQLDNLGPSELTLARSIIDRIERPDHVKARKLLEKGNSKEAISVYENIIEQDPKDIEATINMASALMNDGELKKAEDMLNSLQKREKKVSHVELLKALIKEKQEQYDKAIEILEAVVEREPGFKDAYPPLAKLLRKEARYLDLVRILKKWQGSILNTKEIGQIDIWLAETYILNKEFSKAESIIFHDIDPEDTNTRLLQDMIHVFLALRKKDSTAAEKWASKVLIYAADLPHDETGNPLSSDFMETAKRELGERENKFWMDLVFAVTRRLDPVFFAREYLSKKEILELTKRVEEESELVMKAYKSGKLQFYSDLFRISNRSIGPAAGITALGDTFDTLNESQRNNILTLFTDAIRHGSPSETIAAMGAIGKNFQILEPLRRAQCLTTIFDLASREKAEKSLREKAISMLNILFPSLTENEKKEVKQVLEKLREQMQSPVLNEFFNETIPGTKGA